MVTIIGQVVEPHTIRVTNKIPLGMEVQVSYDIKKPELSSDSSSTNSKRKEFRERAYKKVKKQDISSISDDDKLLYLSGN